ncbi:hypothetical protein, partial [Endozoicomonas sp. ONNA2]|uniref:hypothetical protein n=1 Tax=Endozoicomonas sp. ONNA2 TaxID=2828741 RepID=UPI002148268A
KYPIIGMIVRPILSPCVDTCEAAQCKPELKERKASLNTAIITDKQVELIRGLLDRKTDRLKVDEFIEIIDFLGARTKVKLPLGYAKSPTLLSGIIRNHLWEAFEGQTGGELMKVLLATPERTKQMLLIDVMATGTEYNYPVLPESLKDDIDFSD